MSAQKRMTGKEVRLEVDSLKTDRQVEADKALVVQDQRLTIIAGFYIFSFVTFGIGLVAMQNQFWIGSLFVITAVAGLIATSFGVYESKREISKYWKFAYSINEQIAKVIASPRAEDPDI